MAKNNENRTWGGRTINAQPDKYRVKKTDGKPPYPRMPESVRTNYPKIRKAGGTEFGTPSGNRKAEA